MGFRCVPILRSKAPCGRVLSTLELTYPRFIHSEIMTHRDRERNSGSSRAIPWPVMSERIENDPVVPIEWGTEQKGMVAGQPLSDPNLLAFAEKIWLEARNDAVKHANRLHNLGATFNKEYPELALSKYDEVKIHKSLPNRLTEPWMWITVVMTSTEWNNLFRQRVHPDAEPHFQKIAGMMKAVILRDDNIQELEEGEWHLPYFDFETEIANIDQAIENELLPRLELLEYAKRISVARCARVSYVQHGEKARNVVADARLWDRLLIGSGLGHFSPFGHVAEACTTLERSGPFVGFKQFRKYFSNENTEG
jgi:hypothetical protein